MTSFPQISDEELKAACDIPADGDVSSVGLVCRTVYGWTESDTLAGLADWVVAKPLRIALIILTAFVINRLVRRLIRKSVAELTDEEAMARKRRLQRLTPRALQTTGQIQSLRAGARAETIGLVLKSISSIVIYTIAALMVLGELGINLAPLIAGAGIVGVAVGFGAQSLVKDFLSGLFMLAEDQYGVGDIVDVGDAIGTVEVVNLRTTKLRDLDGTVWHIPNGEIRRVGNMSQQWARALLDVSVAYSTDLDRAIEVVKDVADRMWRDDIWQTDILEEPEVWGVQALAADGITIRLVLKTQPGRQWAVTRELNRRVKDRFDREGIEIPFPQRVMWVRHDEGSSRHVETSQDQPTPD